MNGDFFWESFFFYLAHFCFLADILISFTTRSSVSLLVTACATLEHALRTNLVLLIANAKKRLSQILPGKRKKQKVASFGQVIGEFCTFGMGFNVTSICPGETFEVDIRYIEGTLEFGEMDWLGVVLEPEKTVYTFEFSLDVSCVLILCQQNPSEIRWGTPDRWIHWSYISMKISGYTDEDEEYLPYLHFPMTVYDAVFEKMIIF